MAYVITPKGIMYLLSQDKQNAYCYDDQTGKNETFPINEIRKYFWEM